MSRPASLRIRLVVAVGAVTLLALSAADFAVYSALRSFLFAQVDSQLATSARTLLSGPSGPAGPDGRPPRPGFGPPGGPGFCSLAGVLAPGLFVEIRTASGSVAGSGNGRASCPAIEAGGVSDEPLLPRDLELTDARPALASVDLTVPASAPGSPPFRVRATPIAGGDELVLGTPIGGIDATLGQLIWVELAVSLAAFFGAVVIGRFLIGIGLRPLTDVERTATRIAAGDLPSRVRNADARTEVGRLGVALNTMLEQIEQAFEALRSSEGRLRRFVADASHELRTPIAAVSAYGQLLRRGAAPADVDRLSSGIERESARMARLVEDLLTLARLDAEQAAAHEVVELVGLLTEAVEAARAVGPAWPLRFSAEESVEVLGDPSALRQVVDNLLHNVRSHTPEGTGAVVSISRRGDRVVVEVADEGPGLGGSDASLLFERFVRADPSRSRATGGTGLGLAIVAAITAAHGGAATAREREGGGAIFSVILPLAPAAAALPGRDPAGSTAPSARSPNVVGVGVEVRGAE